MHGYRALRFGIAIAASVAGTFQGALAGAGLIPIEGLDVIPPSALVSGTGVLGAGSTITINCLSGDGVQMPPRDIKGHSHSFASPHREPKGTKKFV